MNECVCGHTIPSAHDFPGTCRCANCGVAFETFAADVVPHHEGEIVPQSSDAGLLGEFCTWFVPQGMVGCHCGKSYPDSYSCCPDLLVMAIGLLLFGPDDFATGAIEFLESHVDMLGQSPELIAPESSRQLLDEYATILSQSLRDTLIANAT